MPQQERTAPVRGARSRGSSEDSTQLPCRAGDVIFCNLQSPWDVMALDVALGIPFYAVVIPAGSADAAVTHVLWPGPIQRWRVWLCIRRTGSLAYLQAAVRNNSAAAEMDLTAIQRASRVPLLVFAESTCGNGKGILKMPAVRLATAARSSCTVGVIDVTYDTPAVQSVVSEGHSVLGDLFRVSVLLYGSASPTWSSPLFPTAIVRARPLGIDMARPADDNAKEKMSATWTLSLTAMDSVRSAMCQRSVGQASTKRQVLSVGLDEKLGFVKAYMSMNAS